MRRNFLPRTQVADQDDDVDLMLNIANKATHEHNRGLQRNAEPPPPGDGPRTQPKLHGTEPAFKGGFAPPRGPPASRGRQSHGHWHG